MKIGLTYGHVASNIGDICINQGVTNMLNKLDDKIQLHVVFRNPNKEYLPSSFDTFLNAQNLSYSTIEPPKSIKESYTLIHKYLNNPISFLEDCELIDCDVLLNNSGEFIFSYENDPRLDLLWRILPGIAAQVANIKFITLPSTLGPFNNELGNNLIESFFLNNDHFAVRDTKSKQLIESLLSESNNIQSFLDPAFFIKAKTDVKTQKTQEELGLIMRLDNFGLRMGGKKSSENYRELKANNFKNSVSFQFSYSIAKNFLEYSSERLIKIFVQTRYDLDLAKKLAETLENDGYTNVITLVEPKSIENYIEQLSTCTYVVSSRFHGCILSLLAGVMPMGVYFESHGHKMPGLYDLLNINEYCHEINANNIDEVTNTFEHLYNDRSSALERTKKEITQKKQSTLEWLKNSIINQKKNNKTQYNDFISHAKSYTEYLKDHSIYSDIEALTSDNKILKDRLKTLEDENNKYRKEIKTLMNEVSVFRNHQNQTDNELLKLKDQVKSSNRDLEILQDQLTQIINFGNQVSNRPSKIKKFVRRLTNHSYEYVPLLSLQLKSQNEVNTHILSSAKSNYTIIDTKRLKFTIPNNEFLYLSTKEDHKFDKAKFNQPINILSNMTYQLKGDIEFNGINITLWIMEYDSNKRISNHKKILSNGKFELTFRTNPNAKYIAISLRITGNGIIRNKSLKWNLIQE